VLAGATRLRHDHPWCVRTLVGPTRSHALGRFLERQEGRDAATSDAVRDAQYDAIVEWGVPDHAALQRLTGIRSPTLIIDGDNDVMIPTKLGHLMAGLIPDARIRVYPDAAHGFLFQYPAEVAADVNAFLEGAGS
jgi:pimeloyl-ACP methyl ester carboxylesterase